MKKIEMLNLYGVLSSLKGHTGVAFNLSVANNLEVLKGPAEVLIKEKQRIEGLKKEYEEERIKAAEKLAEKDSNGRPAKERIGPGVEVYKLSTEGASKLDEVMQVLNTKHREALDLYAKENGDYLKVMDEPAAELPFVYMSEGMLPETLKTEEVVAMFPLIIKKVVEPIKK